MEFSKKKFKNHLFCFFPFSCHRSQGFSEPDHQFERGSKEASIREGSIIWSWNLSMALILLRSLSGKS